MGEGILLLIRCRNIEFHTSSIISDPNHPRILDLLQPSCRIKKMNVFLMILFEYFKYLEYE